MPDCVKQVPGKEYVITRSKPNIIRQEQDRKSQLMLMQITGNHPNQLNHPHKYIQGKPMLWTLSH